MSDLLAPHAARVEGDLHRWLVERGTPDELAEAMRYCVDGGKRLRPAIVHLTHEALGPGEEDLAARAAVAVELVHCYSLVHDDLPAMDDDVLRRGRPTAHVKFGQAMAILAGDALLTRAFGVLADSGRRLAGAVAGELALAAGGAGMIAGQVADMKLCRLPAGQGGLRFMHERKTAALIRAAARMGAICGRAAGPEVQAVGDYGLSLGLAFQLFDDLLDATASAEAIGKTPGKDARAGKRTYVTELGLDRARALGEELTQQAVAALAPLGRRAAVLSELAELLARRTH
ncbi:MAG TPA: farnesyl diphosphate synthase [Phycisphaerae bacterium]|nr:farnesyl diphosphate synthase [Phycisphaerae bacterium]